MKKYLKKIMTVKINNYKVSLIDEPTYSQNLMDNVRSPLHVTQSIDIARMLISKGADVNIADGI
ncbi:MAG: ankyrin repeat domain-containing protein [Deltaproteobacteria bacterium]|nr:ankyrin repeat domain-containing protein [Deltaproteobacteria bacterium]